MRKPKELKVGERLNIRHSYTLYKKLCDEPKPIAVYLDVVYGFMKFIIEMVFQGHSVKLPSRMGTIAILGKKIKPKLDDKGNITGAAPNWKETKALWEKCPESKERGEKIFHLNEHTNGVRYKIFWSKRDILIKNKEVYSLQFTRTNKRTVSPTVAGGKEYTVLGTKQH